MPEHLPDTPSAWDRAVSPLRLQTSWIDADSSGSDFTYVEFLTLRALWDRKILDPMIIINDTKMSSGMRQGLSVADKHLQGKGHKDWQNYLGSIDPGKRAVNIHSANVEGVYAAARYYQYLSTIHKGDKKDSDWEIMTPKVTKLTRSRARQQQLMQQATPSKAGKPTVMPGDENQMILDRMEHLELSPSTKWTGGAGASSGSSSSGALSRHTPLYAYGSGTMEAVEDEQIINTALILFLNALTLHCPDVKSHWTLHRRPFTYCDPKGLKVFEARVDGLLRTSDQSRAAKILVEVKPCYRSAALKGSDDEPAPKQKIRIQETSQMVAWIYELHKPSFSPKRGKSGIQTYSRLLISQDQQEIFITKAVYDDNYLSYIFHEPAPMSFLNMQDYGPFNVTNMKEMKSLGRLMLAFSVCEGC